MGRLTQRHRVTRLSRDGAVRTRADVVAVEEPMELRLAGESFVVTMRTPGHDFELCAGFLVSEGIIGAAEELRGLRYCVGTDEDGLQTYNVIDAALAPGLERVPVGRRREVVTTSACGICGTTSIDAVEKTLPERPAEGPALRIDAQTLMDLPDTLRAAQPIFDRTGGVHAAGIFTGDGELLCLREDVGRHNAVDKVVGWALMDHRLPLTGTALQVSGRASFELVQKAALAGMELLSAVGAPSSTAVDLAERAGLTLVGFSRGSGANVYTHPERIVELAEEQAGSGSKDDSEDGSADGAAGAAAEAVDG